ncbi:hypothetical protein [Streptosporangium vulgare]|uniref:hypothetical protein n=1 Tax=Streptosporangium vulgare TaxID=46190 RepID=UPI0031D67F92
MSDSLDALERRIADLRAEVRRAVKARENSLARSLRGDLRRAEQAWDAAVASEVPAPPHEPETSLLPIREQVHQALTLLGVPTPAKLIVAVNDAFFSRELRGSQLTSLRRDEERSFRGDPYARPYYLCAALTDRLSPARGLLADSTWPPELRVLGPLSPRVDFLTSAVRVAEQLTRLAEPPPGAVRLLSRMAQRTSRGPSRGSPRPTRRPRSARRGPSWRSTWPPTPRSGPRWRHGRRGNYRTWERLFGATAMNTLRGAC